MLDFRNGSSIAVSSSLPITLKNNVSYLTIIKVPRLLLLRPPWFKSLCEKGPAFPDQVEVVVMKELIKHMAQALVDNPEQVDVTEIIGEQNSVFELRVAKEDLGKVIGKQGRTAQAMRSILSAASAKFHKRAVLEIIDKP
jgi:uncharacterized protein